MLAVLSDTNVFSPLTVTPSPDVLKLKLKQVAEKTVPASGESKLLRKVREQEENKRKPVSSDGTKASLQFTLVFRRFVETGGGTLTCLVYVNRKRRMEQRRPTVQQHHPTSLEGDSGVFPVPQVNWSQRLPVKSLN